AVPPAVREMLEELRRERAGVCKKEAKLERLEVDGDDDAAAAVASERLRVFDEL
ncbi:MAG: hypothetical protein INR71_02620, partial [Terriglobus roseus]|nr:hypothetical protein [Terriglobus roseus]